MMVGTQMARMTQIVTDFFTEKKSELIRHIGAICVLFSFLLVLSTVFIVSKDLATGSVSGKYFWFYGSMGLTVIFTATVAFIHKKSFRFSIMDGLVMLFTSSVCLSSYMYNNDPQNTTKLTILFLITVLYFSFRLFLSVYGQKYHIFICFYIIVTALIEAVWGLRQLYGFLPSQHNLFKLTGSFFNPGPYAGYLAVAAPLAAFVIFNGKHKGEKYLPIITLIATMLVLPATMSRAAWLATIAGCLVVIYKKYAERLPIKQYHNKYKKHKWLVFFLILLISLISLSSLYHLKKPSADGRLLTWKISLQTIAKHPLGVGLGNFSGAYGDTQAAYFASGKASETEEFVAGNPEYGFNEYLQILIESGIVSFLLFILIIALALRSLSKTHAGMAGSLIALLVFACFSYPFSVLPFLIIFVFLIQQGNISERKLRIKPSITSIILLLIVSFCLWKQYPVYKAYKEWNKNRAYYHSGLYREVTETYKPLYSCLNDQIQFLFEYGRSLSNMKQYEASNKVFHRAVQISCDPMLYNIMGKNHQAMKDYSLAEACFVRATQIVPNRLYPWYLLMKLYDEMGLPEKAKETAKIVLTKEPKVQSQAIREIREEARKIIAKSYDLVIIFPYLFQNFSLTL